MLYTPYRVDIFAWALSIHIHIWPSKSKLAANQIVLPQNPVLMWFPGQG
jgi:hypothetical protein